MSQPPSSAEIGGEDGRGEPTKDFVSYLAFDGTCEEAFRHDEKVFRGRILMLMRNEDAPAGARPPDEDGAKRIMHARLEAGDA